MDILTVPEEYRDKILPKANLSKANLIYANLSKANLSRANLIYANLSKANLSRANLSGADLSSANLSRANLSEANLSDANLSEANLRSANLIYANLSRANLDYSSGITLSCEGSRFTCSARLVRQLFAHICTLTVSDSDEGLCLVLAAILQEAEKSHRASDLGLLS